MARETDYFDWLIETRILNGRQNVSADCLGKNVNSRVLKMVPGMEDLKEDFPPKIVFNFLELVSFVTKRLQLETTVLML